MPSEWVARAAPMASFRAGWSSSIWSTHSCCTSSFQDHLSWKAASLARLSGVAWKSLPLLKGGSVAMRSMVAESISRRKARLSPW